MDTTPMRRLPERKIWATVESMLRDLEVAYKEVQKVQSLHNAEMVLALVQVRTLSDELIRWILL